MGMGQPGMGMGQPGMGMGQPGMGMGQPGMGMGQPGMGGMPGAQPGGGPPKTMMLQNTEGIVSVAARGAGAIPATGPGGPGPGVAAVPPPISSLVPDTSGATGAFWAICLILGAGVGALAYVIVRVL
jgi:hypothetical protein